MIIHTIPLSVNQLYQGRRFLTKEGKENKNDIITEMVLENKTRHPLEGSISLTIRFYMPNMRKDIDAGLKTLLDCGTGILWADDRQIIQLNVFKEKDIQNPRVELSLEEIETV